MAMLMDAFELLSGMQTELLIFIGALCMHAVLFGSHPFKPTAAKVKGKTAQTPATDRFKRTSAKVKGKTAQDLETNLESSGRGRPGLGRISDTQATISHVHTLKTLGVEGETADTAVLALFENKFNGVDIMADPQASLIVAEAALRCGRSDLLKQLLQGTSEGPRQVLLLKFFANQRRLQAARAVFDACPKKTASLYNALLDACVDCDPDTAEKVMNEAIAAGVADVVTYNTMIKRHVQRGDLRRAEAAIETMTAAGGNLTPNCVTFNELIDAMIRTNSNNAGAWRLIDKMKSCGLRPNSVTCSIMLKTIQKQTKPADVDRTITFVETYMEPMEEILLSSICEACIRAGRNDLLKKHLKRQRGQNAVTINGAHTFGSLIRSYGLLEDMNSVWAMWNEMRSRGIPPTSITIGCMVEALSSSGGDPDAGLRLVHDLAADEQTRPLLNAVIFSSIVKGFAHQKRFDSVWSVHEEMRKLRLEFSITTYNALIDACARGCQMCRVPGLMEAMARDKIEANVVTYSTILKGYCQEGQLDKAFELLDVMKNSDRFHPDAITYNTLIDGCAQRGLYDSGMKLLDEMQEMNVPVSTFTLTVVVKLAGRSKKVDRAFELCETLCQKHRIRPNVHVYNNLIHASTQAGQRGRAIEVLARMIQERVKPDTRTYKRLLTDCVNAGELQDAIGLVRSASGLRGGHPRLAGDKAMAQPPGGLPSELLSEVLQSISAWDKNLAIQLLKELKTQSHVKLDPKLFVSLTSKAVRTS